MKPVWISRLRRITGSGYQPTPHHPEAPRPAGPGATAWGLWPQDNQGFRVCRSLPWGE